MKLALQMAEEAKRKGEVPVGAVIVSGEEIIAFAHNEPISSQDPTAHAEIVALRKAAIRLNNYRLSGCTLYVTLEPCLMCYGAMIHARIGRLVFGTFDPKIGVLGSAFDGRTMKFLNHSIEVRGGVLAEESSALLRDFFMELRSRKDVR